MEIKAWSYEEFPEFTEELPGVQVLPTTGEELGIRYLHDVEYANVDGIPSTLNHHLPDSPEGMEMGGVNLREHPELCRRLSAEENIDRDTEIAPMLIFHGTKDRIVNTRESVLLYNAMKAAGKDVALYLLKGADHGGPEFWTEPVLDIVEGFCRRCFDR